MSSKSRSRAYPAIDLKEAVKAVRLLIDSLGLEPASRESIAIALSHTATSGIAARKVAALSHFGLLERREHLYVPTELAKLLYDCPSEERIKRALRRAFFNVDLFHEVAWEFQERGRVPNSIFEVFQRKGVTNAASHDVSRIFMISAEVAGVLAADGTFKQENDATASPRHNDPQEAGTKPTPPTTNSYSAVAGREGYDALRFPITDRQTVEIWYPLGLNENDIKLMRQQVDFLEEQIKVSRPQWVELRRFKSKTSA